ncbi:MAG: F0F1 ATP synthase subunit epsilon [Candidatus Paceibacteria bacterium]
MHVVIAQVHENLFDGEAESLTLPTADGEITVLAHHEPLVATLKEGVVIVRTKEGAQEFTIEGGVLEVGNSRATVLL